VGQVAGLAMTAREVLPDLAREGADIAEQRRLRREGGLVDTTVETGRVAGADIQVELELVKQFISKDMPLVLVLDDAHDADPGTVEFVRQLVAVPHPVLIVTTAWPSRLQGADDGSFAGLLRKLGADHGPRLDRVALEPLPVTALEALVHEVAPQTADAATDALIDVSDGNPLVLRLLLASPRVTRSMVDGAITLAPAQLRRLPARYRDLIAERYLDLGEGERQWLAEAALQGHEFCPDYLATDEPADGSSLSAFVRISPVGRLRLGKFTERPVYEAVRDVSDAESDHAAYTDEERRAWERQSLSRLQERWAGAGEPDTVGGTGHHLPGDPSLRRVVARQLVRLAAAHPDAVTAAVVVTDAARVWSFAARDLGQHDEELEAAQAAWQWSARPGAPPVVAVRAAIRVSAAYRAVSDRDAAVEAGRLATQLAEDTAGATADDISTAHLMLSRALLQAGDVDGARATARRSAQLADDDEDRVYPLMDLARVEAAVGEWSAARAAHEEAAAIAGRAATPDPWLTAHLLIQRAELEPYLGDPVRWAETAAAVERLVGAGHHLHRHCVVAHALALGMGHGKVSDMRRLVAEYDSKGEPWREELEDAMNAVAMVAYGTMDGVSELAENMAEQAYRSGDDEGVAAAVQSVSGLLAGHWVMQSSAPVAEAELGAAELMRLGTLSHLGGPSLALEAMQSALTTRPLTRSPDSRSVIFNPIALAILAHVAHTGDRSAYSRPLLDAIDQRTAGDAPLQPVIAGMLAACRDVDELFDGHDAAEPATSITELPLLLSRVCAARAVAFAKTDRRNEALAELTRARTAVAEVELADGWAIVARAHDHCGAESEAIELWRGAAARAPSSLRLPAIAQIVRRLSAAGRDEEAGALRAEVLSQAARVRAELATASLPSATSAATALWELGEYAAARPIEERVLELLLEAYGPEDPASVQAMASLALTLFKLKEHVRGRELEEKVLTYRRARLGLAHPRTLLAMGNLAATLEALGDLPALCDVRRELLAAQSREHGDEHPETIEAMARLALVLFRLGEHEEGRRLDERILQRRRARLGATHPSTLLALRSLAARLQALGDLPSLLDVRRELHAARVAELGPDHPDTQVAAVDLAGTLVRLDDSRAARDLLEDVLAARKAQHGKEHPLTVDAMARLAVVHYRLGDLASARALEEQVLASRHATLGPRHPDTIEAKRQLATTLEKLGDWQATRALREAVFAAAKSEHGDESPETVDAMSRLALVLFRLGEHEEGRQLEERIVEHRRAQLGATQPRTLLAMRNLAATLGELGDLPRLRDLQQELLAARLAEHEDHAEVVRAMSDLAAVHARLGDHESARPLWEHVLEHLRERHGRAKPSTIRVAGHLADTLQHLGDRRGALSLQRSIVAFDIRELGGGHRITVDEMSKLAVIYRELGDDEAASAVEAEIAAYHARRAPDRLDAALRVRRFDRLSAREPAHTDQLQAPQGDDRPGDATTEGRGDGFVGDEAPP
jgi:tetratricopeptide (TPR) repeat protein